MPGATARHLHARRIWHGLGRGNRTLDAFAGAAVFRTVSSSMPDVLRLKWWSRTVMLRRLLIAKQPCSLLHYGPFETGGRDGRCPRCLLPDKEASLL